MREETKVLWTDNDALLLGWSLFLLLGWSLLYLKTGNLIN